MAKSEVLGSTRSPDVFAAKVLLAPETLLFSANIMESLNAGAHSAAGPGETPEALAKPAAFGGSASVQLESAEAFRLLVEAVQDYAIFLLDPEGHVSTWNIGAGRIKGYSAKEIIGQHFSRFYPEVDIAAGKPARELETAIREGRIEDEGWRLRKDGSRFWANVIITALRDGSGKLVGFAKVTRDVTERMQALEALQQANKKLEGEVQERRNIERLLLDSERSLRLLSRHLLRSQDEERKRIGRELHDSVGQYLAVLKMNLDSFRPGSSAEASAEQMRRCSEMADQCIKEVRTISYLLYPPMLEEMGLRSAMLWYLDGFAQRSGIQTKVEIPADLPRLPRDVELAVFRVLQESLTNVHRHSGSATVQVRTEIKDGAAVLEIRDQGKGIPREILSEPGYDAKTALGVGLRGMSERSKQLGGSLEVFSGAEGTTIRASIPCLQTDSSGGSNGEAKADEQNEKQRSQGAR